MALITWSALAPLVEPGAGVVVARMTREFSENFVRLCAGPELSVTVFPRDIPRVPRSWIEDTCSTLIHYGEADKGGHFAALEQPEILVSEIRTGLRTLRP